MSTLKTPQEKKRKAYEHERRNGDGALRQQVGEAR
jgi:hypothetical protein